MPGELLTIPDVLAQRRTADRDVHALVSDEQRISYAGLDDASRALASRMVGAGLNKGDRIGLLMPNGIDWAIAALAVMRVGGVLVPLSTLLRPPELVAQLRVANVTHLIAVRAYRNRSYVDDLRTAAPEAPLLRSIWFPDELPEAPGPIHLVAALEGTVRPADDMVVLFTSGSRGAPKGAIHTHGSALRAVACSLEARTVGRGDRLYVPMPFFWTGGFCTGLLSALLAGATLLTESEPEPEQTIAFLERERATLFRGWPDQAARVAAHPAFAKADLSSLRPASLAAVLPVALRPKPGARANIFGMTETAGPWCGARLDLDLPADKHGSCGRPFAGVEVRIIDGEIQLRGPNLMRGFCGRPRSEVFDAAGWYATADLGRVDADGYVWYEGRRDDMFKVKGATVYPTEVETGLRTIPGVAQAFVADVAGAGGAPEVAALVVSQLACSALAEAARARLSAFKVPTLWLVAESRDAVPISATGKIDKPALQRLLRERGERDTRSS
jgi:acyl-CoA synthetase (AMP-forming)/AMP-acid ligase II